MKTAEEFQEVITGVLLENPSLALFLSGIGYLFSLTYGPGDVVRAGMLGVLLLLSADWLSGTAAAKVDGIDTSEFGVVGIKKTVLILMLPAVARALELFMMLPGLLTFFVIGAVIRSLTKSVAANVIRAGWGDKVPVEVLHYLGKWVEDEVRAKDARARKRQNELRGGEEEWKVQE